MVVREVTAMRSGTMDTLYSDELSLTDQILTFCASGYFGVREAVAAAITFRNGGRPQLPGEQGQAGQAEITAPAHLASSIIPPADGGATGQP